MVRGAAAEVLCCGHGLVDAHEPGRIQLPDATEIELVGSEPAAREGPERATAYSGYVCCSCSRPSPPGKAP